LLVLATTAGSVSTALARQTPNGADPGIDGPPAPVPPAMVARDEQGRVTMRATRLTDPIVLDGRLDERLYRDVSPVGDFVQQEPQEGAPATEKTDVWVTFDDEAVYVTARMWESDKSKRVMSDMRRDTFNLYNNDHFAVLFDTFYDRRNGYAFYANAQGGINDAQATNEFPDNNWNTIWDMKAGEFDEGWIAEFRFPFRSMRFRAGGRVWGINFRRMVRWKNEISFLTPIPASYNRRGLMKISSAGTLVGIETPARLRNIDIKPYALASSITDRSVEPAIDNDGNGEFGLDVKWGLTQEFVADFTYNTDFAQVEDDEQQVNLTRFSLFFPEKRDFFLEGQQVLSFGDARGQGGFAGGGGGGPGGGGGGGGFNPNVAPIIFFSRRIGLQDDAVVPIVAGARLIGRAGPYQIGALNMETDEAPVVGAVGTNFSVLRVNRDILRRSRVGMIATRRSPSLNGGDNYAYGADVSFAFYDNLQMDGYVAKTDTPGRRGADTSYKARFNWNADRWGLWADHLFVGEDFNPEIGFLRREAFRRSYAQARFSPRPRRLRGVRKLFYEASLDYVTNPIGDVETRETQGSFRVEFESGDQWDNEVTRSFEALVEPFEVGKNLFVPIGGYTFRQVRSTYQLGPQRPISGSVTVRRGGFYGGSLTELTWRGRVEFSPQFYAEPTISWNRIDAPWGEGSTNLVSSRLTYTITPRMFVAALLQFQSRTDSIASNARFRWEYQPGSELFVVYSDGRTTLSRGFPSIENRSFVVKITRLFRW
jgi:hypothetical protein